MTMGSINGLIFGVFDVGDGSGGLTGSIFDIKSDHYTSLVEQSMSLIRPILTFFRVWFRLPELTRLFIKR